jgi:hypothetical protein
VASTTLRHLPELAGGNQVNRDVVLEQGDIGALAGARQQGVLDGPAGGVGGMQDPAGGVSAFPGQVEFRLALAAWLARERHPEVRQPVDRLGALAHGEAHDLRLVEAGPGLQGVLDMRVDGIPGTGDGGDAALGIQCAALLQPALGEHGHLQVLGQLQGQSQAGATAADDQDIKRICWCHCLSCRGLMVMVQAGIGTGQYLS